MEGALTAREEFLFPDQPLAPLPGSLRLPTARNGRPGIQLLLRTAAPEAVLTLSGEGFRPEWFQMLPVPVEYNTGDGTEQGGAMVLEDRPAHCPPYAVRLAPFRVYDCLRPAPDGRVPGGDGVAAAYICLVPQEGLPAGEYRLSLHAQCGRERYDCVITVRVYDVEIPQDAFPVTNWFSLDAIRRCHRVEDGTPAYYAMVGRYAALMRRVHQTMFYIELDGRCLASRAPCRFDFSYLRPLISCFFAQGFQTLEIGPLLSRGFLPDGMPDMYTAVFRCAAAPDVPVDTAEGYALLAAFVRELAGFLRDNGWAGRTVFHIHDEPDVHCPDERTLASRQRQYLLAAGLLRRYLPGARVIEAVKTPSFRGGVDIWVPVTDSYEERKADFDRLAALGEEVWTYVCCTPEGRWLNRFLDSPLLRGRLLFWGCAANRLGGFLHWGFNQFPPGMDPFRGTSCPNHTGIGTDFPCGDAFLAYPGTDGPWPGMRLEAARRGAEDAALLRLLRQRDEAAHDRLAARVFTDNATYDDDPGRFERVFEELLRLLEKTGAARPAG
ncbi:MAG TPA: DUF4091 domain-containing protein [Firmicutes bacterium]|nr:DUF4091 domain-containing protein [Bacillota bacterium]